MSNNGILYPTVQAMPAGTPRDSAIANQNASSSSQTDLIKAVGGRRKNRSYRKKRYGGATTNGNVTVPQFQMNYTPTGGPGQSPNSVITDNASISSQSNADAVYDNYATQKGGKKGKWGGTNPDWIWGCYSGGRRSKRNIKKRTKRRNKSRSRRKTYKK